MLQAKLIKAVEQDQPTIIVQKQLRLQLPEKKMANPWIIEEVEIYAGPDCANKDSLQKAFGIGVRGQCLLLICNMCFIRL